MANTVHPGQAAGIHPGGMGCLKIMQKRGVTLHASGFYNSGEGGLTMRAFGRALRVDLHRAILAKPFFLTIFLVLAWQCLNCFSAIPSTFLLAQSNIVYVVSCGLGLGFCNELLLPIGAVSYAWSFLQDRESGFEPQAVERVGARAYGVAKVVSTGLSAFLAAAVAVVLFIAALYLGGLAEFPPYPLDNSLYYSLAAEYGVLPYYLAHIAVTGLGAAMAGVFALTVSAFVQNAYVALISPLLCYYAYQILLGFIPNSRMFSLQNILFNQPLSNARLSLLWAVVFLLTLMALCGRLFLWRIKKEDGR